MSGITLTLPQTQMVATIEKFIHAHGGDFSSWCVGITSDPKTRLTAHKVHSPSFIVLETPTENDARIVEAFFKDILGTAGDKGGGDHTSRYVYAFQVTHMTNPCLAEL